MVGKSLLAEEHSTIEKLVALERIQNLYHDAQVLSFAALFVAILAGLMLWSSQPHYIIITWLVAHGIIALLRGIILRQAFKQRISHLSGAVIWAKLYAAVAFISGVTWASLPWVMFDPTSTYNVSAIVIVMFGMVAASNVALSGFPAAFFCFAIPSLGGLFLRLLDEGGDFTYVAIMLIAFILFNLAQSIRIFRMITSSIRQRFENHTLMQHLEEKKREADKANLDKSRFLAATSHDLRQPLHALDLYLGALELNLTQELQKDLMLKVKKSSQSVGELLNALLDISRLDAGEVQVNLHNISLPTLMQDVASEWSPQLEENGRVLRLFTLDTAIQTDPVLLSRMLGNILANAVRHTQGDVLMGARQRQGKLYLEVWDQGEGIPHESHEEIFTEYFQLNNPERNRAKGLGLGLATVKRLSTLLKHTVQIRSFPSRGLCFSIEIPIAVIHDPVEDSGIHLNTRLAGNFILVIDDEDDVRDGLQVLLTAWGCEVLASESGQAAREEMQRDNYPAPDLIIADYRLRENKTGIEAMHEIRALFKSQIPTLIVTGDTNQGTASFCKASGCKVLHKPLSADILKKAIQQLL